MRMTMTVVSAAMAALVVSAAAFAQMDEDKGKHRDRDGGPRGMSDRREMRGRGERGGMQGHGNMQAGRTRPAMLARVVTNPRVAEQIGLSDEQVTTIKEGLYEVQKKQITLKAEMELAGLEQARLLTAGTIDEDALNNAIEKTGAIRTELAKLQMKPIVLVMKTLSPEQLQKAKDMIAERMQQRTRRGRGESGQRGEGGNDNRRAKWEKHRRERRDEGNSDRKRERDGER